MITTFTLTKTSEFFIFCDLIKRSNYIYRGIENIKHSLTTSIERDIPVDEIKKDGYSIWERLILHNFYKLEHLYNPPSPYNKTNLLEVWSIIQHYGGRTRLLDFTSSPGVALYFATWNFRNELDPVIWCIPQGSLNTKLSNFVEKYPYKIDEIKNKGFTSIPDNKDGWSLTELDPDKDHNLLLNYLLRISLNTFGYEHYLKDCVISITPKKPNTRLLMQNGLFLLPLNSKNTFIDNLCNFLEIPLYKPVIDDNGVLNPNSDDFLNAITNNDIILLRFNKCDYKEISNLLNLLNIRTESLFPDFPGLMAGLGRVGPLPVHLR